MTPTKARAAVHARTSRPQNYTYRSKYNAECGKRAAVRAYLLGWISMQVCSEMFRRNPLWRSA